MTNYRTILIRACRGREIADSRNASIRQTNIGKVRMAKAYVKDAITFRWNEKRCLTLISNWRYEIAQLMPGNYESNLNEINTLISNQ